MAMLQHRQAPPPSPQVALTPEYVAFNNSGEILSIVTAFTAVAILAVTTRFYVRAFVLKSVGLDDYTILFSMVLSVGIFVSFIQQTAVGLGKHVVVWTSVPGNLEEYLKWSFASSIMFITAISAVKVSVGLFLVKLSDRTNYTRFIWAIIAFTIVFAMACNGTIIFNCIPIQAAWDTSLRPPPFGVGDAQCFSMDTFRNIGLTNSIINFLTDLIFATMPIPLIWKLQLNTRVKISLITALSLGYFVGAAACVKAVLQWNFFDDPDWSVHDSFNVWADIELNVGILAASLPAMKPLFSSFLKTARALTTRTQGRGTGVTTDFRRQDSLKYIRQNSIGMDSTSRLKDDSSMADGYDVVVSSGEKTYGDYPSVPPLDMSQNRQPKQERESSGSIIVMRYPENTHTMRKNDANMA